MFELRVNRAFELDGIKTNNPVSLYGKKTRWLLYWFMGITTLLFYFIALTSANSGASFIYFGF